MHTPPDRLADAALDLLLGSCCVGCGTPGRVLCGGCEAALPRRGRPAWPSPVPTGLATPYAAGAYEGLLRAMVLQHKEHGVLALAAPLGRVLADVVRSALADLDDPAGATGPVVLVPVPSRRPVVRRRGHDPLLRVARAAAGRLRRQGVPATVRLELVAVGRVRDQATLGAAERAANLAGTMRRRAPGRPPEGRVLVVDDVLTTGSTVREAQRALEEAGAAVSATAAVAATRRRLPPPPG